VRDLCTRGLLSIGRCQSPTDAGGPVCVILCMRGLLSRGRF